MSKEEREARIQKLIQRFTYHKPTERQNEEIRSIAEIAILISDLSPYSREQKSRSDVCKCSDCKE